MAATNTASIADVTRYWNENPVHSVEFPVAGYSRDYFDYIDRLRWTDNERWTEEKFYNLPGDRNTRILDAGCGVGVFTRYYARKGFQVDAVDITDRAVETTKASLKLYGLEARVQLGSVEDLPFAADTFDYIVSNGVIHHTPNTERAVAEFYRVLRPGGTASVCIYYRNALLRWPVWPIARTALRFSLKKSAGREAMLAANTPEELARTYDGNGTPIARIYSKKQADKLFSAFEIIGREPHFFPSRFLSGINPGGLIHRLLERNCGFLIYYLLRKLRS